MSGAALSRMFHRSLEQRSPKAVTAALGDDVELLEVGVERSRVERGTEAKLGEPVRPVASKEHGHLTALDERRRPLGEHIPVRRRLAELDVERLKEPAERGRIRGARQTDLCLRVPRHGLLATPRGSRERRHAEPFGNSARTHWSARSRGSPILRISIATRRRARSPDPPRAQAIPYAARGWTPLWSFENDEVDAGG